MPRFLGSVEYLAQLNQEFETRTPQDILLWAWENLGPEMVATSSFQTQSIPLLHMISQIVPSMPIVFLDTGFHFPETLAFRDQLADKYGLNVRTVRSEIGESKFRTQYGELYLRNPDLCCYINKVEPLERTLNNVTAWISGIRRDQTATRESALTLSRDDKGRLKVSPLLRWTGRDVWRYINQNDLPEHPLYSQGYFSIGCFPCTRPVMDGEDDRSGRWHGQAKTECGIHFPMDGTSGKEKH